MENKKNGINYQKQRPSEVTQMLELSDNNFKATIINMLKDVYNNVFSPSFYRCYSKEQYLSIGMHTKIKIKENMDFKYKSLRSIKGHWVMIKFKIYKENTVVIKLHAPNKSVKYIF